MKILLKFNKSTHILQYQHFNEYTSRSIPISDLPISVILSILANVKNIFDYQLYFPINI